MDSKTLIRLIEQDGWFKHAHNGSHCQYKHHVKQGKVTIPHPRRDLPIKTVMSILKQAGLSKR